MNTTNIITAIKYNYIQLRNRIKADEPLFFATVKKVCIKLGIAALAVIGANVTLSLALPTTLITILSYMVAIVVAIYGTSSLTTTNKE